MTLYAAESDPQNSHQLEAELVQAVDQVNHDVHAQLDHANTGDAGGASPGHDAGALQRAVDQVGAEVERLRSATVLKASDPAAAAAGETPDLAAIRAGLKDVEASMGTDILQQTLSGAMAAHGNADPSPEHTYRGGLDGLLWCFWSFDAPGIAQLPAQLSVVQGRWPSLVIRDSHVMRISDWVTFFHKMATLKQQLEADEPGVTKDVLIAHKLALRDAEMPTMNAITMMATGRRQGGYLLIEDMTAAQAYHISTLPAFVFISPLGIVHRIKGLTPDRGLADWIDQALVWEKQNSDVLRSRGLIP